MTKDKLSKVEQKKKELEEELMRLQTDIDTSFDDVKKDVSEQLDPKSMIRKYPLPALGLSVLIGYLIGREPAKRGRSGKNDDIGSTISSELKQILAKKGTRYLLDMLDQKLSELKQHRDKQ